jgi:peptidoglycan glycosyltransferase
MLSALIVATTYWQAWAAPDLADRQDNAIQRVAQFTVKRGKIYASDRRTVLATNVRKRVKGKTLYFRRYPSRDLAPHVVGYSTQSRSRAGLERSMNDYLTGANANLSTVLDTTLDRLRGVTITGNDLVLTLRPRAQRVAIEALRGQCGAAVALEPRSGKLLVMVSSPGYDPSLIERNFARVENAGGPCRPASRLLNRATEGLYIPGSTFKVVTMTAALDSRRFTPESTFHDPGYCIEYGKRVLNYADQRGPAVYGTVNLVQALQNSINSVFCQLGNRLGADPMIEYMKRYGFYSVPPLETPTNERVASGLYRRGRLFQPKNNFEVDLGRLAFGQERLQVTPLQLAMVAAAVGNRGVVMRPYVVDRIVKPGGDWLTRTKPDELGRAMSPKSAAELTVMMEAVVSGGTGTAAQMSGIRVAGKTGTAETGRAGRNTTSFMAFAPVDRPRVAVAVFLENQSGTGGRTAAPIVRQIMQAILRVGSKS